MLTDWQVMDGLRRIADAIGRELREQRRLALCSLGVVPRPPMNRVCGGQLPKVDWNCDPKRLLVGGTVSSQEQRRLGVVNPASKPPNP